MARPSGKVPYTSKIWQRYDKGASFMVMTGFYSYLITILTFVYIPEFSKHYSPAFTWAVYILSLFLGLMSYWCFFKAALTNPGDIDVNYTSPMPNPHEADKMINPGNLPNEVDPLQVSETIYEKILRHYSEFGVMKGDIQELNQTSATDLENPGGFVLPKDAGHRNCIMNNYCYRHCRKCKTDQPPRSRHCDICKRCVLRYDHHCVVLGNCIGFHNFKPFLLLQLYTVLGGANLLFWFIFGIKKHGFGSNDKIIFFAEYVFPIIFMCMITFGSLGQLVINTFFALKNRTQIDMMEDMNNNVFNMGSMKENFVSVFGSPSIWWLLPTVAADKPTDGHNFPFTYYTT